MAIQGSVVDTQTVVTLTDTAETVSFPENNLTIVGIVHNAAYVTIPLDSSRKAVFPNVGGDPAGTAPFREVGAMRRIVSQVKGTVLNYNVFQRGTSTTVCFYYGTPLEGAKPDTAYAGITQKVTLSGGSATQTLTFPAGGLQLTGVTAYMQGAAASSVLQLQWNVSSGKVFNAYVISGTVTAFDAEGRDIIPLDMPVAQTLSVSVSLGTGADVIVLIAYYGYK